jgi:hypothetical protein
MKIVVNRCFGGFSVSDAVMKELKLSYNGDNWNHINNKTFNIKSDNYEQYRTHPPLIEAIEKVGYPNCNGAYADLEIIKIPDDINWEIRKYDGLETVHEIHRTWP